MIAKLLSCLRVVDGIGVLVTIEFSSKFLIEALADEEDWKENKEVQMSNMHIMFVCMYYNKFI